MTRTRSRKILATFGVRGNRRVVVVRDTQRRRVLVERYVGGRPIRKSFEFSRDGERLAKLYAERWYTAPVQSGTKQLTLRAMFAAFWDARCLTPPEHGGLRPRTTQLYRER